MQYQFANQKDSYFYDIYQDKDAKKKQTLFIYQTKSLYNSKFNQIYPTNPHIKTKNLNIEAYPQSDPEIDFQFQKTLFDNTFILISLNTELTQYRPSIGTYVNIIYEDFSQMKIISNFSFMKGNILYAIKISALTNNDIYSFFNSLHYIVTCAYSLEEKQKLLNFIISEYKENICEIAQDETFNKIRRNYINYLQCNETNHQFENPITNRVLSPIMDIAMFALKDSSQSSRFFSTIPIEINLKKQTQMISNEIVTIASVPYLELYQNLSKYIEKFEDSFYNKNRIYDENELSFVYGKIKFDCYNKNTIGAAFYYKKFNFSGEILFDRVSHLPIGISYVPFEQNKNFFEYDIKKANEFNCFVPFTQKGFVAIMKTYLGAENELSIDNGIFQVTKVKEELTVNAETKEEMNFTFEEIDDTLINGRFNMYQNVSLAEFNEDKNERDMSKYSLKSFDY